MYHLLKYINTSVRDTHTHAHIHTLLLYHHALSPVSLLLAPFGGTETSGSRSRQVKCFREDAPQHHDNDNEDVRRRFTTSQMLVRIWMFEGRAPEDCFGSGTNIVVITL